MTASGSAGEARVCTGNIARIASNRTILLLQLFVQIEGLVTSVAIGADIAFLAQAVTIAQSSARTGTLAVVGANLIGIARAREALGSVLVLWAANTKMGDAQ